MRLGRRRDVTRDFDASYDEHAVVATGPEDEAAGVKAVMVSLQRGLKSMGAVADRCVADAAQSAPRIRLPRLRVARGARRPQVRRVLRERRQGGRRGGDQARRHPGVLRQALDRRPRRPARVLAVSAGQAHPSDGAAPRRRPLPPDRLGRRLPPDRRRVARSRAAPTKPSSTPPDAPATRRRFSIS